MSLPMIGSLRVEVKAARPFTIHGDLYYEIHAARADDPAAPLMALRIPEHAIPAAPVPGQALDVTFLMGQVTAAKPVERSA